jgi:hypothetical protein
MMPLLLGSLLSGLFRLDGKFIGVLARVAREERHFPYIYTPSESGRPQAVVGKWTSSYDIGVSMNVYFVKLRNSP